MVRLILPANKVIASQCLTPSSETLAVQSVFAFNPAKGYMYLKVAEVETKVETTTSGILFRAG